MEMVSAALLLFLIMDPLGNIPVFLSLLKPLPKHRQRIVLIRELLIAFFVLLAFLWGGKYVLEAMHLRQESVSIAGGIIPRFIPYLRASAFRERFLAKGRFAAYLESVAIHVITHDAPGLIGAATALHKRLEA